MRGALSSQLEMGCRSGSGRKEEQSIFDALNMCKSVLLNEEKGNAWPFGLSRNITLNRSHCNTFLCLEDKEGVQGGPT